MHVLLQSIQHFALDVFGVNRPARTHTFGQTPRKIADPRADIRDGRALADVQSIERVVRMFFRLALGPDEPVRATGSHDLRDAAVRDRMNILAPTHCGDEKQRRYKPAFFHKSSTRFFTSGVMRSTSGHSRVKPSPGHLRVASTPILLP